MFRTVFNYALAGAVIKTVDAEAMLRKYIAIYNSDGQFPLLTEKVFQNLGQHAGQAAQKFYRDPKGPDADESMRDYWKTVHADTQEMLPPNADKSLVTYQKTSKTGHWGFMAARLPYSGEEKDILRHMLESFPQGSIIYTEPWRLRIEQEVDKAGFIQKNIKEIQQDYRIHIEKGRPLDGLGALLGAKCLVKVKDTQVKEIDGRNVHIMTVATSAEHNLDGINLWMASVDPNNKGEVVFSNALIGEHPGWRGIDFINNVIGKDLMFTMWRTTDEQAKAEKAKEGLETRLEREKPSLVASRRWYKSVDFFSPGLIYFRNNPVITPNMKAPNDTYIVYADDPNGLAPIAEALRTGDYKSMQKTTEPPGLILNGKDVSATQTLAFEDLSPGGGSRMDHIPTTDTAAVEKFIRTTHTYDLGSDDLTKMQDQIHEVLKDVPLPERSGPVESTVEQILRDTTIEPRLEQLTQGRNYSDTRDAVSDYIERHGALSKLPEHEKRALAGACMYRQTTLPQFGQNGIISTVCQEVLTGASFLKTPQQLEIELSSLSKDLAATESVLAQQRRERSAVPESDPKQVELDRRIQKTERAAEEIRRDAEMIKEARHEAEHVEERHAEIKNRQKEAVEGLRNHPHHGI